jgi:hypothetical protein
VIGEDFRHQLPCAHWKALCAAGEILIDEFYQDIADVVTGGDFVETTMVNYLPRPYLARYGPLFAQKFQVCFTSVVWKLAAAERYELASVAEELALFAIIGRAVQLLEMEGREPDFSAVFNGGFRDLAFTRLFNEVLTGSDEWWSRSDVEFACLRFENWFAPMQRGGYAHPYVGSAPT